MPQTRSRKGRTLLRSISTCCAARPISSAIRSCRWCARWRSSAVTPGRYVHWGATTQDIMDTAVVLQVRDGLAFIERDLTAVAAALEQLAVKHRDTVMAGRTHLQQALPITFGYKAAIWLAMIERHRIR